MSSGLSAHLQKQETKTKAMLHVRRREDQATTMAAVGATEAIAGSIKTGQPQQPPQQRQQQATLTGGLVQAREAFADSGQRMMPTFNASSVQISSESAAHEQKESPQQQQAEARAADIQRTRQMMADIVRDASSEALQAQINAGELRASSLSASLAELQKQIEANEPQLQQLQQQTESAQKKVADAAQKLASRKQSWESAKRDVDQQQAHMLRQSEHVRLLEGQVEISEQKAQIEPELHEQLQKAQADLKIVGVQQETTDSNVLSQKSLLTQHRNRSRLCSQCSNNILNLDAIFAMETTTAVPAGAAAIGAQPTGSQAAVAPAAAGSNAPSATASAPPTAGGVGVSAPSGSAPSAQQRSA